MRNAKVHSSVTAADSAVYHGNTVAKTKSVHDRSCFIVVNGKNDRITAKGESKVIFTAYLFFNRRDFRLRCISRKPFFHRAAFAFADVGKSIQKLSVEIAFFDTIKVTKKKPADSCPGEMHRNVAPETAAADDMLIIPIVSSLTCSVVSTNLTPVLQSAKGLRLSKGKTLRLLLNENKYALLSVVLTAFSRSIAEVGAVSLVGGNIQWKTRVMTTAIMLETNKGNFSFALALGCVLLLISLIVNILAGIFSKDEKAEN